MQKVYTFQELQEQALKGKLNFDEISREQLFQLYMIENKTDSIIGELYQVTTGKAAYKRKKYNIQFSIGHPAFVENMVFDMLSNWKEHDPMRYEATRDLILNDLKGYRRVEN